MQEHAKSVRASGMQKWSILTELCGYRPLGIMLSHTLKLRLVEQNRSGAQPYVSVQGGATPNYTIASSSDAVT